MVKLPISTWTYGFDHDSVRHIGPMAQDFAAAFGVGSTDRMINMVDANGVCMASIQALHRRDRNAAGRADRRHRAGRRRDRRLIQLTRGAS